MERRSPLRLTASRVGFLGCGEELSSGQLARIRALLLGFGAVELHHGGRKGADMQVHVLADDLRLWRFVHPDVEDAHSAGFRCDAVYPLASYTKSRAQIVDFSGAVIAVPAWGEKPENGPTWEVARRARLEGKALVVVGHEGEILRASTVVFGPTSLSPW